MYTGQDHKKQSDKDRFLQKTQWTENQIAVEKNNVF